jgi:GMP synthase-like glutamine amidotransferase
VIEEFNKISPLAFPQLPVISQGAKLSGRASAMILFVKNIDIEGPETIGGYFKKKGFAIKTVGLDTGGSLPEDGGDLEAVVVLGGPMNVYEEDKYPFLKDEDIFIKKILEQRVPFLGICLGAQLLAKAAGARVGRSPQEEIGFSNIHLTADGKKDPLFNGIPKTVEIFQWHGDMFEIPLKAKLLASSKDCPHQAFKAGPCAYGFQFHIEITDKSIHEWSGEYWKDKPGLAAQKNAMLQDYQKKRAQFARIADKIYDNFLGIILEKTQGHKSA